MKIVKRSNVKTRESENVGRYLEFVTCTGLEKEVFDF